MAELSINTQRDVYRVADEAVAVVDFNTKQPKTDQSGRPWLSVPLVKSGPSAPEIILVRVPGPLPKGLDVGVIVRPVDLTANVWTLSDGRHGVSYKASTFEIVGSPPPKA